MIDESEIGRKIRMLRLERGLNLQELADKSGFTKGYLSKVENSKKAPPVSTLLNLARVLGVNLSEIFSEEKNKASIVLTKKSERKTLARDGTEFGYSYEPLALNFPGRHMDPYVLTAPAKQRKKGLFQHGGEEMLMVLEGTMHFTYGDQEFLVEEGDCIYFDASVPHRGIAEGSKPAKSLMVIFSEE
jgi:transcriptional regulator with XRE-family HTH domain